MHAVGLFVALIGKVTWFIIFIDYYGCCYVDYIHLIHNVIVKK
jgi:hypothetical protein